MILQELAALADRKGWVEDPDFELKPVAYIVSLTRDGRYLSTQRTEGERRGNGIAPKKIVVPRQPQHGVDIQPGFLVDNAQYVMGHAPNKDPQRVRRCADSFLQLVTEAFEATRDPHLKAVLAFLQEADARARSLKEAGGEVRSSDLFAFEIDGVLVHQREAVCEWWKMRCKNRADKAAVGVCLVTGREESLVDLHHDITGVPGAEITPLVSYNRTAFESYGLVGNENAPVSRRAAVGYSTALNRLLENRKTSLHLISKRSVAIFWARREHQNAAELPDFASLFGGQAEDVKAAYESIHRGRSVLLEDTSPFFAVILAGAKGRISIRSWLMTTVSDAIHNVARYFTDIEVAGLEMPAPLWLLVKSLAPRGKVEELAPNLGQQIFEAALFGRPLPTSIVEAAVRRCRVEGNVTPQRAALIKAYLNGKYRDKEVKPTMDDSNDSPGYVLGRLFAQLELMQYKALGDRDSNIVDRYFSSACATPQAVFPRLLKLSMHHFRKARDGNPGAAVSIQKRINQLCARMVPIGEDGVEGALRRGAGRMRGFPRYLPLEEQGLFVLGYHAQCAHNTSEGMAARERENKEEKE